MSERFESKRSIKALYKYSSFPFLFNCNDGTTYCQHVRAVTSGWDLLWLVLQENCYSEKVMDVRGTYISFSSRCHGTCTPPDRVCTSLHCRKCESAQTFCQGGCLTSFCSIFVVGVFIDWRRLIVCWPSQNVNKVTMEHVNKVDCMCSLAEFSPNFILLRISFFDIPLYWRVTSSPTQPSSLSGSINE